LQGSTWLDPAIHRKKEMDARVTGTFTRVFYALSPRMTVGSWPTDST